MRKAKTYIDRKGYRVYEDSGKRVHRVVMERMIGRPLRKGEHVHHINGTKTDNRRTNLKKVTPKEHYGLRFLRK